MIRILQGDCREVLATLPDASVHCCVTSPPYFGLRDYGCDGQIGMETTHMTYVFSLVKVFEEVHRVLRDDGTLWLNLGDSYAGSWGAQSRQGDSGQMAGRSVVSARQIAVAQRHKGGTGSVARTPGLKPKDLMGMPWRVAFALQTAGWYLRQDIIWAKPNPMPESVTDRCTKAHEYVFLLSKSERYFYNAAAIAEPAIYAGDLKKTNGAAGMEDHGDGMRTRAGFARGVVVPDTRNKRSVWSITSQPFAEAHFATMPPELAEMCVKAGCPEGGTVLDPFGGAGTTGLAADRLQRDALLIELNPSYIDIARRRIAGDAPLFAEVAG